MPGDKARKIVFTWDVSASRTVPNIFFVETITLDLFLLAYIGVTLLGHFNGDCPIVCRYLLMTGSSSSSISCSIGLL